MIFDGGRNNDHGFEPRTDVLMIALRLIYRVSLGLLALVLGWAALVITGVT